MIGDLRTTLQAAREFLIERSAAKRSHSGATLLTHLFGTADILMQCGASEAVVLAGLFHSAYGTASFRDAICQWSERPALVELIGIDAERWVWLFCRTNNRVRTISARLRNEAVPVVDRVTNESLEIGPSDINALASIEIANLLEQNSLGNSWELAAHARALGMIGPYGCRPFRLRPIDELLGARDVGSEAAMKTERLSGDAVRIEMPIHASTII
ncbi:DUF6817 domain-containing protein [Trinickia acidisoli]|uniref:DUF6817 domain-containing protein n=1 Tax=Trinickia acidisoli TaxID=2767482 RepID=UPI001A9017F7|nr:hypothetical protein [Trinickia acidisoli]